jgi:hypothetical protein
MKQFKSCKISGSEGHDGEWHNYVHFRNIGFNRDVKNKHEILNQMLYCSILHCIDVSDFKSKFGTQV